MAVTDLTGTKWKIKKPSEFVPVGYQEGDYSRVTSVDLIYKIYSGNYESAEQSNFRISQYFDISTGSFNGALIATVSPFVYPRFGIICSPSNSSYVQYQAASDDTLNLGDIETTIEITGGTDATNSDLIAWLQANATQITNLTAGETYKIKETIQVTTFDFNGSFTFGDYSVDRIAMVSRYDGMQYILDLYSGSNIVWYAYYINLENEQGWSDTFDISPILTINENVEVPISFLDVFEKVSSPEPSNIFSIGNLTIDTIYFGELPVLKVYLGDILVYESKPVVEDSNFLLNGGDYLYCSDGAIFDTRVISVETSAGEVVTTWSGGDIQVYDE